MASRRDWAIMMDNVKVAQPDVVWILLSQNFAGRTLGPRDTQKLERLLSFVRNLTLANVAVVVECKPFDPYWTHYLPKEAVHEHNYHITTQRYCCWGVRNFDGTLAAFQRKSLTTFLFSTRPCFCSSSHLVGADEKKSVTIDFLSPVFDHIFRNGELFSSMVPAPPPGLQLNPAVVNEASAYPTEQRMPQKKLETRQREAAQAAGTKYKRHVVSNRKWVGAGGDDCGEDLSSLDVECEAVMHIEMF